MSAEALTIVATGIALAALDVGLIAWLRSDLADVERGQTRLEDRLGAVEREQTRAAGLLEGLGLAGRAEPSAGD